VGVNGARAQGLLHDFGNEPPDGAARIDTDTKVGWSLTKAPVSSASTLVSALCPTGNSSPFLVISSWVVASSSRPHRRQGVRPLARVDVATRTNPRDHSGTVNEDVDPTKYHIGVGNGSGNLLYAAHVVGMKSA
jgi:hypothetical protein